MGRRLKSLSFIKGAEAIVPFGDRILFFGSVPRLRRHSERRVLPGGGGQDSARMVDSGIYSRIVPDGNGNRKAGHNG